MQNVEEASRTKDQLKIDIQGYVNEGTGNVKSLINDAAIFKNQPDTANYYGYNISPLFDHNAQQQSKKNPDAARRMKSLALGISEKTSFSIGGRKRRKSRRKTRRGGKRRLYRVKAVKAWLKRTKRRRKKRKSKKKKKKRRRRRTRR